MKSKFLYQILLLFLTVSGFSQNLIQIPYQLERADSAGFVVLTDSLGRQQYVHKDSLGSVLTTVAGDNLGNHIATMTLNMSNNPVDSVTSVTYNDTDSDTDKWRSWESLIGYWVLEHDGIKRLEVQEDGSVNFNDAYIFPNTDGGAGYVLVTDGAGTLSWVDTLPMSTGDNLGNHIADTSLNMVNFNIYNLDSLLSRTATEDVYITFDSDDSDNNISYRIGLADGAGNFIITQGNTDATKSKIEDAVLFGTNSVLASKEATGDDASFTLNASHSGGYVALLDAIAVPTGAGTTTSVLIRGANPSQSATIEVRDTGIAFQHSGAGEYLFPNANASGALSNDGAGNLSWSPTAGNDNLGNHTATQNLLMEGFVIDSVNLITYDSSSIDLSSDSVILEIVKNADTSRITLTNDGAGTLTKTTELKLSPTDLIIQTVSATPTVKTLEYSVDDATGQSEFTFQKTGSTATTKHNSIFGTAQGKFETTASSGFGMGKITGFDGSTTNTLTVTGDSIDLDFCPTCPLVVDGSSGGAGWFLLSQGANAPPLWVDTTGLFTVSGGGGAVILNADNGLRMDVDTVVLGNATSGSGAADVIDSTFLYVKDTAAITFNSSNLSNILTLDSFGVRANSPFFQQSALSGGRLTGIEARASNTFGADGFVGYFSNSGTDLAYIRVVESGGNATADLRWLDPTNGNYSSIVFQDPATNGGYASVWQTSDAEDRGLVWGFSHGTNSTDMFTLNNAISLDISKLEVDSGTVTGFTLHDVDDASNYNKTGWTIGKDTIIFNLGAQTGTPVTPGAQIAYSMAPGQYIANNYVFDVDQTLTDGYYLKYSAGTGEISLSPVTVTALFDADFDTGFTPDLTPTDSDIAAIVSEGTNKVVVDKDLVDVKQGNGTNQQAFQVKDNDETAIFQVDTLGVIRTTSDSIGTKPFSLYSRHYSNNEQHPTRINLAKAKGSLSSPVDVGPTHDVSSILSQARIAGSLQDVAEILVNVTDTTATQAHGNIVFYTANNSVLQNAFQLNDDKTATFAGAYTLPAVDGAANQVLKTNGVGGVSWQNDSTGASRYAYFNKRGTDFDVVTGSSFRTIGKNNTVAWSTVVDIDNKMANTAATSSSSSGVTIQTSDSTFRIDQAGYYSVSVDLLIKSAANEQVFSQMVLNGSSVLDVDGCEPQDATTHRVPMQMQYYGQFAQNDEIDIRLDGDLAANIYVYKYVISIKQHPSP